MPTARQIAASDVQFAPATLSGSRSLSNSDNGLTLVYSGSSNITLTVPSGLTSGFGCTVVQLGTGVVSFAASGVTFDNVGATIGINTFVNLVNVSSETYAFQNPVVNVSRVLMQSGIPFILVSSGSIGNNGALSGITALPTTYPNAYVYFPANAIYSGSAAGWYYCVFSSTTAATIYNNTYTSGAPTIPASPTAFSTTGPGAFTQTTATDIWGPTYTLPGGTLGTNGRIRVSAQWSYTNSANTKTFRSQLGGTAIITSSTASSTSAFRMSHEIWNRGRVDRQETTAGSVNATASSGSTYTSVDTSTNQDLRLGLQIANASDNLVIEAFSYELMAAA